MIITFFFSGGCKSDPNIIQNTLQVSGSSVCLDNYYILKQKKSDFHGTVSFDPVKMSQQK